MPNPAMVAFGFRFVRSAAVVAACAIAWLAAVGIAAWLVGLVLSDRWWWSQWLAWIPTLGATVAAGFGWLAAWRPVRAAPIRRWRILVWSAILVAIGGYFLFYENRPWRSAPTVPADALRIVHWNVSSPFRDDRWATPERVLRLDADVVILTDAWRKVARGRFGDHVFLARSNPFGVISHLPIVEARPLVAVDDIYAYLLRIDATETAVGREVAILAIDLPSDLTLSRMALARRLRSLLIDVQGPPEDLADIFIGDFNITRGSASLRELLPGTPHAWREGGRGWSGTYPRALPIAHIDHVFVRPDGLRVIDYEVIDMGIVRHRVQRVSIVSE